MTPEPLEVHTPRGAYPIVIESNSLDRAGEAWTSWGVAPGPVAVVSDDHVAPLYAERLCRSLRSAGFTPTVCTFPAGEPSKTLATVAGLYPRLLEAGLDRRSAVVGLGGGVVGDVAGFVAATYLRGVALIQVPTSLLAMVDASVGGKTGVDLPEGKNLVGAFKQPEGVWIDPEVLGTLPEGDYRAGLGEVLKHGLIDAPELVRALESSGPLDRSWLIERAVRVKVSVVEEDPYERGRRAVLNLGHTFGHALEVLSGFRLRHGEAVGIGLVAAAELAWRLGRCSPELAARLRAVLTRHGLPTRATGYRPEAVRAAMRHDKKRAGGSLRVVIPEAVGRVDVVQGPDEGALLEAIATIV